MAESILITGCSSGIGRAVAFGLRQAGYSVYVTARQEKDLQALRLDGFRAWYLDYRDSASIQRTATEVLQETGGTLYALFNNGAYGLPGAVEDIPRWALEEQFHSNLFGWHELTNLLLPAMRQQGRGRIIHNSSILGFAAMPFRGAYNASKFALEGLTDTLRLELRGSGIFVSLIEPGPITSRFRQNGYQHFLASIDWQHSLHRESYERMMERLLAEGPVAPFTKPAEAILTPLLHALTSRHPRARYPVTVPTHVFAWLKRLLPTRTLDYLLIKAGGAGRR